MILRKLVVLAILPLAMACVFGCGDEAKNQPKIVGGKGALAPGEGKTIDQAQPKVE
jgi:hypothetical protein